MLAAAETAHSKLAVGPSPRCAKPRVSSTTVARLSQGCSSRRTISSPVRAVERQCTRRRSSPRRYSRVAASSSPCTATERARLSPLPAYSPASRTVGSGDDLRDHGQPVDAGEGPGQLAQPERVGEPDHQRTDRVAAAHVGAHRVRHRAGLVRAEPLQHDPGPAAQRVRQPVLQQQGAGGQPGHVLQAQHHPGAGADRGPAGLQRRGCRPACTGCGPTYAAASSGSTASSTATRSRSRSPRMSAEIAAAAAAARKDRPRVVSPRSASRTSPPP